MGIFQRLRANLNSLKAAVSGAGAPPGEERLNFALEVPGPSDKPLWRMELQMHAEPHGDGEKLRLRAHFQTNLASALRPALERPVTVSSSTALTLSARAGSVAQNAASRALQFRAVRALAEPLLQHDLNTWFEVHASSASLDSGAQTLMPQGDKLAALGIVPKQQDGPVLESWAGEAPGGFAQVSLMQVDKRQLPPDLQRALGAQPFQFAAAMVNTVERK